MLLTGLLALVATLSSTQASPTAKYARHTLVESRSMIPDGWTHAQKLDRNVVLPMRIGLVQSNLDMLEDYLMDVSSPQSSNWGKHWSADEIAEVFSPSSETIEAVRAWLASSGIAEERVRTSTSAGWLHFNATVAEAEELLHTEYHVYEHEESGTPHVACKSYKVPEAIRHHIDFILPTVQFDAKIQQGSDRSKLSKRTAPGALAAAFGPIAHQGTAFASAGQLAKSLKNCSSYITPQCLRALYEIPVPTTNLQTNPLGIVEYTPQSYLQSDLNLFFQTYQPKQRQTTPNLESIDGGFVSTVPLGFGGNGESNLDLEYAMTLVNPIEVNLYQVGDAVEGASFNNFLDAIDGSYCTYDGGDDPNQDAKYPDPYNYAGAFEGPEACGTFKAPKVISTSYAYSSEFSLPAAYQIRQCNEYAKLGLAGTSVLYSSGDSGVGVSGTSALCPLQNSTFGHVKYSTNKKLNQFTVSFPGNCPYVTSVGATALKNNTSVLDANPEEAADIPLAQTTGPDYVFASGGGFSSLFSTPKYQKSAVKNYFANYNITSYAYGKYNATGLSRGVPDVSANGAYYVETVNGTFSLVYGTSASCPTFASIVTIVNEQRKAAGKGSIGFLNPMLYNNPEVLTDITQGRNPGCGSDGFKAVPGWDPLTGLGTPDTPRMLELFNGMP